ncbi:MAG: sigma-70 family RNA polymerase sigma factor [Streptosporangiaceae bacterium]
MMADTAFLVARAGRGDQQAWDALVERYAPLIWSICRRYRLSPADADDVGQSVWLRLVDRLDQVRDPAALPGWIVTTTRRECGRLLRATAGPHAASPVADVEVMADRRAGTVEDDVLAAERHAVLLEAVAGLPPAGQQLMALLIADPPLPYAAISATLGIPVGSIGPNRRRCLDKIRRHPAMAALIRTGEPGTPQAMATA